MRFSIYDQPSTSYLVEATKPVPQEVGTGGGQSEWCNRLLVVPETRVANFSFGGSGRRGGGSVEHHCDVVRWGIRRGDGCGVR